MIKILSLFLLLLSLPAVAQEGKIISEGSTLILTQVKKEYPIRVQLVDQKEFLEKTNQERPGKDNTQVWCAFFLPKNSNETYLFIKRGSLEKESTERSKEIIELLDRLYPVTYRYKQRLGFVDYTAVGDEYGNLTQKYEDNWVTGLEGLGTQGGAILLYNGYKTTFGPVNKPQYSLSWKRERVLRGNEITMLLELKKKEVKKEEK